MTNPSSLQHRSRIRYHQLLGLLISILVTVARGYSPVSLTTTSRLPQTQPEHVHRFLASPANWPRIVASSHFVQSSCNVSKPLPVDETVDEIFGLPPLLPLSVTWKCLRSSLPTYNTPGFLEFYSARGVPGLACECRMLFQIRKEDKDSTYIQLTIEYKPESPLAVLAIPVLTLDNAFALRVFLPQVIQSSVSVDSPLNQFRNLMGILYGVAGLAHAADCLLGSSQLLVASGSEPFERLSLLGQAYAILWCAMGPLAFGLSIIGGRVSDFGLIAYGIVEVWGAWLIQQASSSSVIPTPDTSPFVSAILVQVVVALSWLYSSQRRTNVNEDKE